MHGNEEREGGKREILTVAQVLQTSVPQPRSAPLQSTTIHHAGQPLSLDERGEMMEREGRKRGNTYQVLQASVPESRYARIHHNPPLTVPQAQTAN